MQITEKDVLTPQDVAKILHVSLGTVYDACDKGEIPCIKIKKLRRIPAWRLEEYLNKCGKAAQNAGD